MSDDILRREYAEELKHCYLKTGFKQGFEAGYTKAKEDFERLRGEWVLDKEFSFVFNMYECSKCRFNGSKRWHFCPNCGVPMSEKALEIIRKREGDDK